MREGFLSGKMVAEEHRADLDLLFTRWKGFSDASAQYATYANLVLARILGTVRARTEWSAAKLQENFLKLSAESGLGFARVADCLGEKIVRNLWPSPSYIPSFT